MGYGERREALGRVATFLWSRALTTSKVSPNMSQGHPRIGGLLVAILDSMPLFGFGFLDAIDHKLAHILLVCVFSVTLN